MERNLVLFGPPGAGKGTQAVWLARTWRIAHISTGALLRDEIKAGTALGREVKSVIDRGALIDDGVITKIVGERLQRRDAQAGFLLDGFPRTLTQARSLDDFVAVRAPLVVVELVVPEEVIVRRLAARMICSECGTNAPEESGSSDEREAATCHNCGGALVPRADDAEHVVRKRLEVYRLQTEPLVGYYGSRPTFCRVDGDQLADRVTAAIVGAVDRACGLSAISPPPSPPDR